VSLLIKKILYSDTDCNFEPIKRPGILTYVFSLDVTTSNLMKFYSSNLKPTSSQIIVKIGA